jgi:hypothetical protein
MRHVVHVAALAVATSFALGNPARATEIPTRADRRPDSVDIVRGRVFTPDSVPMANAMVALTPSKSGKRKMERTDAKGMFRFAMQNGHGEYELVVLVVGMARYQQPIARKDTGDIVVPDIYLKPTISKLSEVKVVAEKRDAPGRWENQNNHTAETTTSLWSDAALTGALNDILSRMAGVQMTANGFSVLGMDASQNSVTLNGAVFVGGLIPAGMHAVLVTNTYDVSRGGFSGGQLSFQSHPAQPYISGNLNLTMEDPRLQWTDPAASRFGSTYRNLQLRGTLQGPIKSEKWAFNASLALGQRTSDLQTLLRADATALTRLGIAGDSLNRFLSVIEQEGIPMTRSGIPSNDQVVNNSINVRVDHGNAWGRDNHTQTFSILAQRSNRDAMGLNGYSLPIHGGENVTSSFTSQFTATDKLFGIFLNQFLASLSTNRNQTRRYVTLPDGRVLIASTLPDGTGSISTLQFGGNAGFDGVSKSTALDFRNETSWQTLGRKHVFKATINSVVNRFENTQNSNRLGTYAFNSLSDFEDGRPASFTRTLYAPTREGGTVVTAASIGDSWRKTPRLQFLYGLRLEGTKYLQKPDYNPAIDAAFDRRTDFVPNALALSPSAAFQWSYGKDRMGGPTGTIQGGIRQFVGSLGAPSLDATGLPNGLRQITCIGDAIPQPDWDLFRNDPSTIPTECVGGGGETPFVITQPYVSVMDPDYRASRRLGTSLGWRGKLLGKQVSLNGEYSRGTNQESMVDLNLNRTPIFTLPDEDGRPVFVASNAIVASTGAIGIREARLNDEFGAVMNRQSDMHSIARQLTVGVSPGWDYTSMMKGRKVEMHWNLNYVYANNLTETRGFSGSTSGNPFVSEWGPSGQPMHSFNINMSIGNGWGGMYDFSRRRDWGHVSANIRIVSGTRYTPTILGDVNGDGLSNDRAFIFDPADGSDAALASAMSSLIDSRSGDARDCLLKQLGSVAGRNSCTGPWSASLSLSYRPNLRRFWKRGSMEITIDNPLGALDQALHGWENMRGWGQTPLPDPLLLSVRGFDAANQRFIYEVNPRFGETRRNAFNAPFAVRVEGGYYFHRRGSYERQMLDQVLGKPDKDGNRPKISKDSIKKRIQYWVGGENLFQFAIQYRDTIMLVDEQLTRLIAAQRDFTMEADSMANDIAQKIIDLGDKLTAQDLQRLLGQNSNEDDEMAGRQAQARSALRTARWGRILREILTPEQWSQLPVWMTARVDAALNSEADIQEAVRTGRLTKEKQEK